MARKIITWHIPVSTLVSAALVAWIFGGETWFSGNPLVHVLSRRINAWRFLHGHRLCDVPNIEIRAAFIRSRCRSFDSPDKA